MMDEELLEVRRMFLDEAQAYVDLMDDGLVGIDPQSFSFGQQLDLILRAVHSLADAAGNMEYTELWSTAHRLESSLQIIKSDQSLIIASERLLLNAVGLLREIITINRQGKTVDLDWLETHDHSIFKPLEANLNITESRAAENIPEHDLISIIFEQEINEMLGKLEHQLDDANPINLDEELQKLALELADLGEMLELPNFVQLNMAIAQSIQTVSPERVHELAVSALMVWRRSQALVFEGNQEDIPAVFNLEQFNLDLNIDPLNIDDLFLLDDIEDDSDSLTSLEKAEELELEALLAFSYEEVEEEIFAANISTDISTDYQESTDKSSILLTDLESILESFNPFDVIEVEREEILNSEVVIESNTLENTKRIVLIEVNQMILAIPTSSIQEVIRYKDSSESDQNSPILHQNSFITIFPFANYLQNNYPQSTLQKNFQSNFQSDRHLIQNKPPYATKSILILNHGQIIWGIYVNGCWGEQEVTLSLDASSNIAETMPKIFTGYAIIANEQAVPILNMQIMTTDIMEG